MQYAHPIENLNALVNLYRKEVIKIEDAGAIPVPETQRNYDRRFFSKYRDDLKPLEISQPEGTELQGQRLGGHVAAVEVSRRFHAARGARAARHPLR
jgi:Cu2+-containing amine oxidase